MAIYGYVGLPEGGPECEKIFIASLAIMTYDDLFADLRIAMTRMMTHKHFREWYTVIYSIQKKKHACVYINIYIYIYLYILYACWFCPVHDPSQQRNTHQRIDQVIPRGL